MVDKYLRSERWTRFGEWVARSRDELSRKRGEKVTQEECARQAEMSVKQWSRIENGASGTDLDTIARIARVLDADVSDAYRAAGIPSSPPVLEFRDGTRGITKTLHEDESMTVDDAPEYVRHLEEKIDVLTELVRALVAKEG